MNFDLFNGGLDLYKTTAKILCGVLSATFTLAFLNIDERDPESEKIHLQSPSLVYVSMAGRYSNAEVIAKQEEADRLAEEADTEEEADAARIYNSEFFSLDNYTIVAPVNYEEIANYLRKDEPQNNENYDGKSVWAKKPVTIYEEGNASSKVVAKVGKGTRLIRISYSGGWSYVRLSDGQKGYLPTSLVSGTQVATPTPSPTPSPSPKPKPKPKKKKPAKPKVSVKAESRTVYITTSTNARSGPGISYAKVTTVKSGTAVKVVARTSNGWLKSDKGWYILGSLTSSKAPSAKKKNTPTPKPKNKTTTSSSTKRGDKSGGFAKYIRSFIGCRYVSGGASPSGFDCSGFTMYCYKHYYNIKLPHGANMQTKHGRKVSFSSMQVGDIIYFDHDKNGKADHVGLYVGNGEMVHASGVKTGVKCVSVSKLKDVLMVRRML